MPVQTQCRPFQHSSAVMGNQPCSPQGPILGGHGHPHGPPLHVWCEGKSPTGGFYWVVGENCGWQHSLCAERLDKKHVYQRVASKPPQRAKSLSHVHPAMENRPLVSGRSPGWTSLC